MNQQHSILITHIWSDRNKGDSAIVAATILQLKQVLPEATITLMSEFAPRDARLSAETFQLRSDFPDIEILGSLFPILPVQAYAEDSSAFHATVPSNPKRERNSKSAGMLQDLLRLGGALWYTFRSLVILWLAPLLANPGSRSCPSGSGHTGARARLSHGLGLTRDERRTLDAIICADLVVSKGGGFIFSQPSLRSTLRLYRVLFPLLLARRLKKPVALLGQSIGPFSTALQRTLARHALRNVTFIGVREAVSRETVRNLVGSQSKTKLIPDMAFSLPCADTDTPQLQTLINTMAKYARPWIGLTVRRWGSVACPGDDEIYGRYLEALAGFCQHATTHYKGTIFIWPQCTGPDPLEDDRLAASDLMKLIHGDAAHSVISFNGEYTARVLKAAYSQMDAFVGTRFHSAIFAISSGVPTLAIDYWGPKAPGIMHTFGQEEYVLSYQEISEEQLISTFDRLWTHGDFIRRHLAKAMSKILTNTGDAMKHLRFISGGGT